MTTIRSGEGGSLCSIIDLTSRCIPAKDNNIRFIEFGSRQALIVRSVGNI